ncbi:Uncharacterized protein FWK35_00036999 [Aphis craccivora]|uniref:Uncharacterized protein n=1 Tax=Aphis craccivora TaxID=307492 RepID=A0A6G0W020_APHCR|nr:Uncharacterized protein FWK35_00036999 [Aphis craccivora]
MDHRQHFSKSTNQRRFIEEVGVVDLFRDNSTESQILSEVLSVASISSHVNISHTNDHSQSIIHKPSSCNDTDDLYISDEYELLDSASGSDIDSTTENVLDNIEFEYSGFNFYNNDTESMLKALAQWAVSHNITNVTLSALLKLSKGKTSRISN